MATGVSVRLDGETFLNYFSSDKTFVLVDFSPENCACSSPGIRSSAMLSPAVVQFRGK